jgi:hypothetical protein
MIGHDYRLNNKTIRTAGATLLDFSQNLMQLYRLPEVVERKDQEQVTGSF